MTLLRSACFDLECTHLSFWYSIISIKVYLNTTLQMDWFPPPPLSAFFAVQISCLYTVIRILIIANWIWEWGGGRTLRILCSSQWETETIHIVIQTVNGCLTYCQRNSRSYNTYSVSLLQQLQHRFPVKMLSPTMTLQPNEASLIRFLMLLHIRPFQTVDFPC